MLEALLTVYIIESHIRNVVAAANIALCRPPVIVMMTCLVR